MKWIGKKDLQLVIPKKKNNIRDPRNFAYALVYGNRAEGYSLLGWLGGDTVCSREPHSLRKDAGLSWNVPQKELSQDWRMLQLIATSSAP